MSEPAPQLPEDSGAEFIKLKAEPLTDFDQQLASIDDTLLQSQLLHLEVARNLYHMPLVIESDETELLKEPALFDEFLETVVIDQNPAITKVLERVQISRGESNTRLLRILRNTIAALTFKGIYSADDERWEELARRL